MARGKSGRIVLVVDPELKKDLYLALEQNELTLREWFILMANHYIDSQAQPTLFPDFGRMRGIPNEKSKHKEGDG